MNIQRDFCYFLYTVNKVESKSDIWNKIPGLGAIPQYYLYDRQGKRVWETTGFGKETLKEIETEINRVLEQ